MRKVLLPIEKGESVLHRSATALPAFCCAVACSLQNHPGFASRRVQGFLATKAVWDFMELLKAAVERIWYT